jgi:hypothetical protein
MENVNWAAILPFASALSVAFTIIVGISGLRQGHYSKGKLTPRGRKSLAWMVGLGVITLIIGFADRQISTAKDKASAAKDKADADVRSRQFNRQMASLRTVTGKLDQAQIALQDSLRRQEIISAAADRNLMLSQRLQQQAQRNTDRVVRRIVDDTNRFTFANMAGSLVVDCPDPQPGLPRPVSFQLLVQLEGRRGLAAIQQRATTGSDSFVIFDRLEGALNNYDTLPPWEGSRARLYIRAVDDDFRRSLPEQDRSLFAQNGTRRRQPIVCPFQFTLAIKGQLILLATGTLEEISVGIFSTNLEGIRPHLQAPITTRWLDIHL